MRASMRGNIPASIPGRRPAALDGGQREGRHFGRSLLVALARSLSPATPPPPLAVVCGDRMSGWIGGRLRRMGLRGWLAAARQGHCLVCGRHERCGRLVKRPELADELGTVAGRAEDPEPFRLGGAAASAKGADLPRRRRRREQHHPPRGVSCQC